VRAGLAHADAVRRAGIEFGSYMLLMGAVCMLAYLVPTRRALRVHPVEALRGE
jgi:ABC-type antimicrobial peptide transport system permease subunit